MLHKNAEIKAFTESLVLFLQEQAQVALAMSRVSVHGPEQAVQRLLWFRTTDRDPASQQRFGRIIATRTLAKSSMSLSPQLKISVT